MAERLPQNFIPTNYDLYIHFKPKEYPFKANVVITFKKNQDDDKVILNINNNIAIEKVTQNGNSLDFTMDIPKLIIYRSKNTDQDISTYPIRIDYFVLPLSDDYFYERNGRYFTNFEPNFCRALLPCFDEPCVRSTFSVKIRIPSNLVGISNMPIETVETIDDEKEITFMRTPAMCSYLLCICVGPFQSLEGKTKNGLPVRFYFELDDEHSEKDYIMFINIATFAVEWMEEKMNVKYQLPHLQFISHKEVIIGMENYGLIALKDCLNCEFLSTSLTIIHEIVHLWFGDLVSIKWWDSIWLNEGFANYFEYLILSDCLMKNSQYAIQLFTKYEALKCLAFFSNDKLFPDEDELKEINNDSIRIIHYAKGSFVLKMFSDIVGENNFLKVCSAWISTYQNMSVQISEFIETVNKTLENDYTDFFNTWLKNVGFPLLNVVEIYDESDNVVGIIINQTSHSGAIYRFNLPILYEKNGVTNNMVVEISEEVTEVYVDYDWIIVNDKMASLCAVVYSEFLLKKLVDVKNENKIDELNSFLIANSPWSIEKDFMVESEVWRLCKKFSTNEQTQSDDEIFIPSSSNDENQENSFDDNEYCPNNQNQEG